MTPGAFVAFVIVWAVVIFALWKQYDLNQETKQIAKDNRALIVQVKKNQARIRRLAKLGAEAHAGACAEIEDFKGREAALRGQIRETEMFLRSHPNGIGEITPSLIRASLDRERASLTGLVSARTALEVKLHCAATRNG